MGAWALASALLGQSAACPAGGLSYKPEITPYSSLLPTPPKAPFIGPAALGLEGTASAQLLKLLPRGLPGVGVLGALSKSADPGRNGGSSSAVRDAEHPGSGCGGLL